VTGLDVWQRGNTKPLRRSRAWKTLPCRGGTSFLCAGSVNCFRFRLFTHRYLVYKSFYARSRLSKLWLSTNCTLREHSCKPTRSERYVACLLICSKISSRRHQNTIFPNYSTTPYFSVYRGGERELDLTVKMASSPKQGRRSPSRSKTIRLWGRWRDQIGGRLEASGEHINLQTSNATLFTPLTSFFSSRLRFIVGTWTNSYCDRVIP